MNRLTNFEYNRKLIQRRDSDGLFNMTQMCQANGKNVADFLRLKRTKLYLEELSREMGIPISEIIQLQHGNQTWGNKAISVKLARWLSVKFELWCDAHLFVLMESGSTSLEIDPIAEMKLKIELAKLERDKAKCQEKAAKYQKEASQLEQDTLHLRKFYAEELPKPIADRILGVTEIKEIEYRDRIILDEDLINDGSTVTKAYLCERYGFVTKKGTPSYAALNKFLAEVGADKSEELWDSTMSVRTTKQFKIEHLDQLDRAFENANRQMFLGE